ncbi:MAG: GNAT family N-acetyltransferase [Candidatus Binatia bacterium]
MKLEVVSRIAGLDPGAWDSLVGDGTPFLEWGFLSALEESGAITRETGWLPQHLVLRDGKRLVGACPLYVKGNSYGEFVFDHGWADAAMRAGIRYYPKLLVAAPLTPATGARFLTAPDVDRPAVIRALGGALRDLCEKSSFSSVHVNFCLPDEAAALEEIGFLRRTGVQFQWRSPGGSTFDDYLASLRAKRRNQALRERRELARQGIEIEVRTGDEIDADLVERMYRLYLTTVDKFVWGQRYLNLDSFRLLHERWRQRLCFVLARREGELVAGTFNVRKRGVLYGRYWGTHEEIRYLHFNVCYYAAIEYCLAHGLERFEPGAGGEFKHLRGFEATPTVSLHWLADPGFAEAVAEFLQRERRAVAREIRYREGRSALRKPAEPG